ncbi:uncharacterized protein LAESUDRAFT_628661, partial [Laetiporus sulphureus 93-53]
DDTDVYRIAIAMCPDKKLEWFKKNPDWWLEDHAEAERVLRNHWKELCQGQSSPCAPATKSKWARTFHDDDALTSSHPFDSIDAYLEAPIVSSQDIKQADSILAYWSQASQLRSWLAHMALDYLSAPASSVDAERVGHLAVSHLQHQVSSQTFKAQMAVGSWVGTPLLPDMKACASLL